MAEKDEAGFHGGGWNYKNVMPYTILEHKNYTYAIIDKDNWASFNELANHRWIVVDNIKYWVLLKDTF